MNTVFLIGNLTRDPELTETASGTSVCRFGLAVNRRSSGNEQTDFYNVTAFQRTAETIAKYKKKGDKVAIVGDIQIRQYEDNQGQNRTTVDVIVQNVEFLNSKSSQTGGDYDAGEKPASSPRKKPTLQAFDDDGDIPF